MKIKLIHKYRIAILLLLCAHSAVYGQLETSHWYFGKNAGLDFTSGVLVIDNSSQMDANEGTASFSDEFGNLLFYTDGNTVYTRNHTIMPNGTGLHGHRSSTQSSIIIPAPDTAGLYYIFTTDAIERFLELPQGSQSKGLNYSIVNMSLGEDGEVTVKNIPLPLSGFQRCNEQLTAVAKADCSGYWVITSYFGKFYSFSITSGGVDANPVVSTGGPNSILPGAGYIRASHDGKKIAYTSFTENGGLRVYDFNNNDGTLSNENILYALPRQYYGVEFSPDNTVLYASTSNNLLQYDLTSMPAISEVTLATDNGNMQGALQLGPDNKIYYADKKQYNIDEYLSVINDPDNFGSPGYVQDAVSLGRRRGFGLPNFIPYLYHIKPFVNGTDGEVEVCEGVPLNFSYCHLNREFVTGTVVWNFGDGATSTEESPNHIYGSPGAYTVTATVTIGGKAYASQISVTILPAPSAQNAQLSICVPSGQAHTFNLAQSHSQIYQGTENVTITFHTTEEEALNDNSALPVNHAATASKMLWIRVENAAGCFRIRQLQLVVNQMPVLSIPSPVNICIGTAATLQVASPGSNTISWYIAQNSTLPIFSGNNFQTPLLTANTDYWVEALSPEGCKSARIKVTVIVSGPTVSVQNVVACAGNPVTLTASSQGNTINWYESPTAATPLATGATFTTPALSSNISYWVEAASGAGCSSGRVIVTVTINAVPIISVGNIPAICPGSAVLTATTTQGNTINWYVSETGAGPVATGTNFTTPPVVSATSYWAEAVSPEGCRSARIQVPVMVNSAPVLTISTTNPRICEGATATLSALSVGNTINWYDSAQALTPLFTGPAFTTSPLSASTSYWVEGISSNGCVSGRIEIPVTVNPWTTPAFALRQQYCEGEQAELLPAISDNGIYGTWSPPRISTATPGIQTYTFTPNQGHCTGGPVTVQVEVFETVTPRFSLVTQYFFEEISPVLPNVSDNGVTGIWTETSAVGSSSSGITKYTFTPDDGQCADNFTAVIKVINYPKFFTPNNDGVNDMWNIWGFTAENKAEIRIFDRYGKLLKQLNPLRQAWDGTYNGKDLFSTDYWFVVTFVINGEHREFRSHFSLVR